MGGGGTPLDAEHVETVVEDERRYRVDAGGRNFFQEALERLDQGDQEHGAKAKKVLPGNCGGGVKTSSVLFDGFIQIPNVDHRMYILPRPERTSISRSEDLTPQPLSRRERGSRRHVR